MTTPTEAKSYADTVAPYPEREGDVTAVALARHLACQVQADVSRSFGHYYFASPPGDKAAAREYALLLGRLTGYYGALRLLRALIEHAPDKADEVAKELWGDWEDGANAAELTCDWLTEYGIDPDRIGAETEPVERITEKAGA